MADVLIPIKEFPRCCGLCPCFHAEHPMYCQADKTTKMTAPYGKRMEDCPLVALPEHGRLIDADELLASDAIDWGEEAWNGINHAPTVLEAST